MVHVLQRLRLAVARALLWPVRPALDELVHPPKPPRQRFKSVRRGKRVVQVPIDENGVEISRSTH